jgi:hypothetical protein
MLRVWYCFRCQVAVVVSPLRVNDIIAIFNVACYKISFVYLRKTRRGSVQNFFLLLSSRLMSRKSLESGSKLRAVDQRLKMNGSSCFFPSQESQLLWGETSEWISRFRFIEDEISFPFLFFFFLWCQYKKLIFQIDQQLKACTIYKS